MRVARVAIRAAERAAHIRIDGPIVHAGGLGPIEQPSRSGSVIANVFLLAYCRQRGERRRWLVREQKLLYGALRVSAIQLHSIIYRTDAEITSRLPFIRSTTHLGTAKRTVATRRSRSAERYRHER